MPRIGRLPLRKCLFCSNSPFSLFTAIRSVLIEELNLNSFNSSGRTNITLHDFENKLSALVASMYWTCEFI
jgi:hypothetical protein